MTPRGNLQAVKLGLRFHSSDAHIRDLNDACNCYGVPPEWGCSCTGHIGQAVIIAREKGSVRYSDIAPQQNKYFSFLWQKANSFNTSSNKTRALFFGTTMAQWLRLKWNDQKSGSGVAKGYGDVLEPTGRDENGDIIYKYTGKR